MVGVSASPSDSKRFHLPGYIFQLVFSSLPLLSYPECRHACVFFLSISPPPPLLLIEGRLSRPGIACFPWIDCARLFDPMQRGLVACKLEQEEIYQRSAFSNSSLKNLVSGSKCSGRCVGYHKNIVITCPPCHPTQLTSNFSVTTSPRILKVEVFPWPLTLLRLVRLLKGRIPTKGVINLCVLKRFQLNLRGVELGGEQQGENCLFHPNVCIIIYFSTHGGRWSKQIMVPAQRTWELMVEREITLKMSWPRKYSCQ